VTVSGDKATGLGHSCEIGGIDDSGQTTAGDIHKVRLDC